MGTERGEPRTGRARGLPAGSARAGGRPGGDAGGLPRPRKLHTETAGSRSTPGSFVSRSQSTAPGLVNPLTTRPLPPDPRGARSCGGDSESVPCPALGAAPPRGTRTPWRGSLRTRRPPYPRRPLRARLRLFTYRDALRAARRAPGDAEPSRQRPLGRPDPPSGFRCRHFRRAVQPQRAGVRGGSETNSARGSSGARWRRRWAGGGGSGGVSTCSARPVETVGGRPPRGEEQRLRGPTCWAGLENGEWRGQNGRCLRFHPASPSFSSHT